MDIFFEAALIHCQRRKNVATEVHFIKVLTKLMSPFDGATNYYCVTVCCDGKCLLFETGIISAHKQWQQIKL